MYRIRGCAFALAMMASASFAATPPAGGVSPVARNASWQGKTFLLSDPGSAVGNEIGRRPRLAATT